MSAAQRQVVRGGMAALCSAPSGSAGPRRAALQRRPPVPPQQRQRHQQHQQRRQRLPAPGGVGSSSGQDSRGEATRAAWSTAAAAPPAPRADPTAQGARCGAAAALSTCSQTRASASAQSGPIGHGTMTHRGRSCRPASSHGGTASGMRPHGSWCAAVAAAASPSSRFGGGRLGHARSSGAAPHSISAASTLPSAAPRTLPRAHAFNIDVQARMERAWARQHEAEAAAAAATAALLQPGAVTGVSTLAQLDALVEAAGTNLVVVFMYSRTCGVCKETRERVRELARVVHAQRARVVFMQHNVFDDYDCLSDIARLHKVRAVPAFLFIDDGAVVESIRLRDIRSMGGSKELIRATLADDVRRLKRTLWEVLVRAAPSAR